MQSVRFSSIFCLAAHGLIARPTYLTPPFAGLISFSLSTCDDVLVVFFFSENRMDDRSAVVIWKRTRRFNVPCDDDSTVNFFPARSLLLFRDSDGVDALDEKQGISLLTFDDSLALLDLLYLRSVFRDRLKSIRHVHIANQSVRAPLSYHFKLVDRRHSSSRWLYTPVLLNRLRSSGNIEVVLPRETADRALAETNAFRKRTRSARHCEIHAGFSGMYYYVSSIDRDDYERADERAIGAAYLRSDTLSICTFLCGLATMPAVSASWRKQICSYACSDGSRVISALVV